MILHFRENIFILRSKSVSRFSFKNYERCFLFHPKNSFRSSDIQIFVFFLPVNQFLKAWSKINLKVYDVFNCLKKNFVWYLEKKKKVWHWNFGHWCSIKEGTFLWKNHTANVHQKQPKTAIPRKKFFSKGDYQKPLKK